MTVPRKLQSNVYGYTPLQSDAYGLGLGRTFLKIENSDGDTIHTVVDSPPELETWEVCKGLEYLRENNDTNYWPEGTVVVIEVTDGNYGRQPAPPGWCGVSECECGIWSHGRR